MKRFAPFGSSFVVFSLTMLLVSCSPSVTENNHIHSIAFDPTEQGVMYVATHYYLEKINLNSGEKERLGDDDFMGFIIAADGNFYSSGHSSRIANVGIRKSADKGKTWNPLAYQGSDFHDLTVSYAHPQLLYGWSTPPNPFMAYSSDAGKSWTKINSQGNPPGLKGEIISLAADQQQLEKLYAGTLFGLFVSENAGNWIPVEKVQNIPVIAIAADPLQEGKITVAALDAILQTKDHGLSWEDVTKNFNQKEDVLLFLTIDPNSGIMYGISKHSIIYRYSLEKWEEVDLN